MLKFGENEPDKVKGFAPRHRQKSRHLGYDISCLEERSGKQVDAEATLGGRPVALDPLMMRGVVEYNPAARSQEYKEPSLLGPFRSFRPFAFAGPLEKIRVHQREALAAHFRCTSIAWSDNHLSSTYFKVVNVVINMSLKVLH